MLIKAFVWAIVCGACGAALWTGVSYFSGWELGVLAVIVGGLVGYGATRGNAGRGGVPAGLLAGVVAFFAILGGKFGVAHFMTQKWISENATFTQDDAFQAFTSEVYEELGGDSVEYAEWTDDEMWPTLVWEEASERWGALSPEAREAFRVEHEAAYAEEMHAASGLMSVFAFILSFGLFDLLWFALALSTAYGIASKSVTEHAAEHGIVIDDASGVAQGGGVTPVAGAADRAHRPAPASPMDSGSSTGMFATLGARTDRSDGPSIAEMRRRRSAQMGQGGDESRQAA